MRLITNLWIVCVLAAWLSGISFAQCHASIEAANAGPDNVPASIASTARQSGGEDRTVVVELVLRKSGAVRNATVTSGPTTLREAAIEAVKKRNYKKQMDDWPFQGEITVEVKFPQGRAASPKIRHVMPGGVPSCVPAGQPMGYMPPPWSGVLPQLLTDLLRTQPKMPVLAPEPAK
jgi:Gram-negative bacterial TonB protein C-terminal